ncbi:MAG: DUF3027 domain-containing protein [Mobiluncus sp.]|uniref:DUF3027 domain-containing protein n=1 Tax=Mobiluncus sp. TaxID=47293 RepID=UPI00258311CC|nr:DUF3027 domain-containing protein [Mobiluncus sp.]MCI6585435.1 DUF3027 domain-containing protein [Mobiluncus sp.]
MARKKVLDEETPQPDGILAKQVDFAKSALTDMAKAEEIGEHLTVQFAGERVVTHFFECLKPGYKGWVWAVTLARVPHARTGTISETDLLPSEGALLAPPWIPWAQRLEPGDLSRRDATPYDPDDPNLDQGYEATGEDADEIALWELGLGRKRVLNHAGRDAAVKRWLHDQHSRTELDRHGNPPDNPCSTCGYLWKIDGSLRLQFGLCTNAWSPDDGHVVAMNHTCGAHSETDADLTPSSLPVGETYLDDQSLRTEEI